jgi:hypothetical protein
LIAGRSIGRRANREGTRIPARLGTLWNAILALRAKARLREALERHAALNDSIKTLIVELAKEPQLTDDEVASARKVIERVVADDLELDDQKRLEKGLHQRSKIGEARYIKNLLPISCP